MSRGVKVRLPSGKKVALPPRAFVAAGGEGSVYARGDVAYKIYDDPARAIAAAKIAELARIAHPGVLVPREILLRESDGAPIGYTMRFVTDAWALTQLVPSAFWARHGLTAADARRVALALCERIGAVHAAGCCVGDLSGTNVLVTPGSLEPYLVDTDSFFTPGFSGTAITPEIADPSAPPGRFSAGSDWFAFAVLVFELFAGMHPFKGRHPTVRGMAARMRAGISALRPEVARPGAWRGTSGIPSAWVGWLRDVLEGGHRGAPSFSTTTTTRTSAVGLEVAAWLSDGTELRVSIDRKAGVVSLSGKKKVVPAQLSLLPSAIIEVGGRVILHVGDRLVALDPVVVGDRVFVGMVTLATVMPFATTLWPGIAICDVVGQAHATLLDAGGTARVIWLPEIDRAAIVDAAFDGRQIDVLVRDGARTRRLCFVVGPDGARPVPALDAGAPAA